MPTIDIDVLSQQLPMPEIPPIEAIEIPPPPEVPQLDWSSLLQPLDVSHLSSTVIPAPPTHEYLIDIPDPLQAAADAARAKAEELEGGPAAEKGAGSDEEAGRQPPPRQGRAQQP